MKFILNFLTSVFFFPFNLFKILINLNKIINSDVILLQESRNGYGNVYTSLDLFRHIFKNKKKLSISFLETHRFHNTKVFELFNYDSLILKTCFNFKKKVFGEFYKKQNYSYSYKGKNFRNFEEFSSLFQAPKNYFIKYNWYAKFRKPIFWKRPQQEFFIYLIKILKRKDCKVFSIDDLYNLAIKKSLIMIKNGKKSFFSSKLAEDMKWINAYFLIYNENSIPGLKKDKNEKLSRILNDQNQIKACLYFRGDTDDKSTYSEKINTYLNVIKLLSKKSISVYLTGDFHLFLQKLKVKKNIFYSEKFDLNPYEFDSYAKFNCDYFFGSAGGGAWPCIYNKKTFIFDSYPYGFKYPKSLTLEKKLYNKKLKKFIRSDKFQFKDIKDLRKLGLFPINNSSNKILGIIKNVIKK